MLLLLLLLLGAVSRLWKTLLGVSSCGDCACNAAAAAAVADDDEDVAPPDNDTPAGGENTGLKGLYLRECPKMSSLSAWCDCGCECEWLSLPTALAVSATVIRGDISRPSVPRLGVEGSSPW